MTQLEMVAEAQQIALKEIATALVVVSKKHPETLSEAGYPPCDLVDLLLEAGMNETEDAVAVFEQIDASTEPAKETS